MTPEGKVKRAINKVLDKYKSIYKFMPVPSGYGKSSLDYILCFHGRFIAVEAKAPGKKPTARQKQIIDQIRRADGVTLVIDSVEGAEDLALRLSELEAEACNPYK